MSQYFEVHPDNSQPRLFSQAGRADPARRRGSHPHRLEAMRWVPPDDKVMRPRRCRRIRGVDDKHHLTLLCRDQRTGQLRARRQPPVPAAQARHAGAFTFIPRRPRKCRAALAPLAPHHHVRVPDHAVTQALLEQMGQPLIATTLIAPGEHEPMNDPHEIRERFQKLLQAVVDAGACPMQPTTVVDPLARAGAGAPGRGELAGAGAGGRERVSGAGRHGPVGAHIESVGCAGSLRYSLRRRASPNSLLFLLRPLRSNTGDESEDEARVTARRPPALRLGGSLNRLRGHACRAEPVAGYREHVACRRWFSKGPCGRLVARL